MTALQQPGRMIAISRTAVVPACSSSGEVPPDSESLLFLNPTSPRIADDAAAPAPAHPEQASPSGHVTTRATARRPVATVHENVLCVPRATIFPDGAWHGLVSTGLERVLRTIRAVSQYRARHLVEDDPDQQQIIPYCIVRHQDGTYLLTRRLQLSSERRLHNLYSLGVGGHVNPVDGLTGDPVAGGLAREWREEIVCDAPATARLVAVLNDDSSPVSRVHLGLVFLVEPAAGHAMVRETEKLTGEVMTLEEMRNEYLGMESWSQLVYDDLMSGAPQRAVHSPLVVDLPPAPG